MLSQNCEITTSSLIEYSMPWACMAFKYKKHARYQEGRIRYLEQELQAASEEINYLKAGNNHSKIKDQGISDNSCNWSKPKNSNPRLCTFSADDVPNVKLWNWFSVLHIDQCFTGFWKHVENNVKPLRWRKRFRKGRFFLLRSSHGRKIVLMLQDHQGTKYEIKNTFITDAPLVKVGEDLGKLGNDFTKLYHVTVVGETGKGLNRNYHYSN